MYVPRRGVSISIAYPLLRITINYEVKRNSSANNVINFVVNNGSNRIIDLHTQQDKSKFVV